MKDLLIAVVLIGVIGLGVKIFMERAMDARMLKEAEARSLVYRGSFKIAYEHSGACTGFVVSPTTAITAAHCVVMNNPFLGPQLYSGQLTALPFDRDVRIPIEIREIQPSMDWALLEGDFSSFQVLDVEDRMEYNPVGRDLVVCGIPMYMRGVRCISSQVAAISAFSIVAEGLVLFGQSGGPIMDVETGKVVGLLSAVSARPKNKNGEIMVKPLFGFIPYEK